MVGQNLVQIRTAQQIPNGIFKELLKSAQNSVSIRVGTVPIDAAQDAVFEFYEQIGHERVFLDNSTGEYLILRKSYNRETDDEGQKYSSLSKWIKRVARNKALDYTRKKVNEPGSHISIDNTNDFGNSGQHLLDFATNDNDSKGAILDGQAEIKIGQAMSDLDEIIADLDHDPNLYDYIIDGFHDCLMLSHESYQQKKPSKSVKVVNAKDEAKKQILVAEYLYIFTKCKFTDEESLSHTALCEALGLIMVDSVAGNFKAQFMGLVSNCLKSKLANYITED